MGSSASPNMMKVFRLSGAVFGLLLSVLFIAAPAFSQAANQGQIQGGVFDQSGGVIVGAMVTVTDVARGVSRTLTTDNAGAYVAPNLNPGTYSVKATAPGFQTVEHDNIVVEVGKTVRVDATLPPGAQTQAVTVTSEAPSLDTTDATVGGTITQAVISTLPLVSRNFKNLMTLRPAIGSIQGGGGSTDSANGTRAEEISYTIDGLRVDEPYGGQSIVNNSMPAGDVSTAFPVDAIQEFNVESNPKAQSGWKAGAIIDIGVKSGTNSLHGTGYAYGRTTGLDARNFFDQAPLPKQPISLEQFGGNMGGPILKGKLFWFADYDGLRYDVGNITPSSTPATVSIGSTKLSLVDACNDLETHSKTISPLSAHIVGLNTSNCTVLPQSYAEGPNLSVFPANTTGNPVFLNLVTTDSINNGVAKMDYHLNDKNVINGTFFRAHGLMDNPSALGFAGQTDNPFDGVYNVSSQLVEAAWDWTPSSARVNEFRVGYIYFNSIYNSVNNDLGSSWGFNTGVTNPLAGGFPQVQITPFSSIAGGPLKRLTPDSALELLDNYSILHGNHTFKFGGEFTNNVINTNVLARAPGRFKFSNLENFLQGTLKNGNQILAGDTGRHLTNEQYALFGQDDWRVTRNITVNLGLRWEYNGVLRDSQNRVGAFDPTLGLVQVGKQISTPYNGDFREFSPRLGLAWDMRGNGKTVLRAGGSLMYSVMPGIGLFGLSQTFGIGTVPTGATIITQATGPAGVPGSGNIGATISSVKGSVLSPGWQGQTAACISGSSTACPTIFPSSVFNIQCGDGIGSDPGPCGTMTVAPNFLNGGRVTTWTLGIQQALTNNLSLDVSYVGTHGSKLPELLDINQPALGSGYTPKAIAAGDPTAVDSGAEQLARPYYSRFPYLSYINQLTNGEVSNYNSLQVTLNERTWHGLSFLLGYTYSHALDDASTNVYVTAPINSLNPALQYGASDYDIRNRFTLTTTYAIPGRKAPAQLLEGWGLHSIVTLQSGQPWTPRDLSNDFTGTDEVNNFAPFGEAWNFSGNRSDFTTGPNPAPCWSGASGAALAGCAITGAAPPAQCVSAASAMGPNTLAVLNQVGCYVKGNSVLFPAALGTIGDSGRNQFRDSGFKQWDLSVTKDWKFRERLNTRFRVDFYNILNVVNFANPGGVGTGAGFNDPSTGPNGSFGCGCVTPDQAAPNPVLGTGAARSIQLGLILNW